MSCGRWEFGKTRASWRYRRARAVRGTVLYSEALAHAVRSGLMSAVAVLALSRQQSDRAVPRPPVEPPPNCGEQGAWPVARRRKKTAEALTVSVLVSGAPAHLYGGKKRIFSCSSSSRSTVWGEKMRSASVLVVSLTGLGCVCVFAVSIGCRGRSGRGEGRSAESIARRWRRRRGHGAWLGSCQ
jgi:hypothetical protein